MSRWDETFDFTQRLQRATNHEAICEELLKITGRYGLDRLIAGTIPIPGRSRKEQARNILFAGWPEGWMTRYLDRNYAYVDPVLMKVMASPGSAFTWTEAVERCNTREGGLVMNEAREHGLAQGFAVPMVTLEGDLATISFGGEQMDLPPTAAGLIHLIGVYAIGRAFYIQGRKQRSHPVLTRRELDCLRWCCEGKTDWEISVILGIAESTVRSYLNTVLTKLDVVNRTQLAAEAVRSGLIR